MGGCASSVRRCRAVVRQRRSPGGCPVDPPLAVHTADLATALDVSPDVPASAAAVALEVAARCQDGPVTGCSVADFFDLADQLPEVTRSDNGRYWRIAVSGHTFGYLWEPTR